MKHEDSDRSTGISAHIELQSLEACSTYIMLVHARIVSYSHLTLPMLRLLSFKAQECKDL